MFYISVEYSLFLFFTNFTNFPQNLFIHANKNSNFALTGIGLGLIYNQRVFWISNVTLLCVKQYHQYHPYLNSNINYFYFLYSTIQILLFCKNIYLYKLLKTT